MLAYRKTTPEDELVVVGCTNKEERLGEKNVVRKGRKEEIRDFGLWGLGGKNESEIGRVGLEGGDEGWWIRKSEEK